MARPIRRRKLERRSVPPVPEAAGDLLVRFRDGDGRAFQELFDAYGERLVQFFYRLCWDRDRAEDFTQDLFLRLVRRAAAYRPEGRLATFIFRVATNLWIDHYRASRPLPRLYSLDQPMLDGAHTAAWSCQDRGTDPVGAAIVDEEKERLRSALEALNEPHRLVLELAVYQELPYGEISDILDIPVGTVKSRMFNTVRALKERLRGLDADVEPNQAKDAGGA
ncbi:MAG: sigma-70 family RNA polymerase sigma factor [Planctomycetota bacterium]